MKRWLLIIGCALLPGLLLWQGEAVSRAVREGLALCGRSVIPALFPFMIAVRFSIGCGISRWFSPAAAAFCIGIVGGYPMGAAAVGQFYRGGELSRREAMGLLCCCNNAGPAFILTFLGRGIFADVRAGLFLWCIHLASAGVMAALFYPRCGGSPSRSATSLRPAAAFVSSVTESAESALRICSFVVFFHVITSLLITFGLSSSLLLGALELTCGGALLPRSPKGLVLAAALLGWGGVSVHGQATAVLQGTDLSPGRYIAAKALQGILSAVLALAALPLSPV